MPRLFLALILTLLFTPLAQAAHQTAMAGDAAQRYALVIGNDQYAAFHPPLEKAGNDARAMAKVLEKAGFKATLLLNGNEKRMNAAVNEFVDNIAGGGIGVLFFAGHGVQINNQNYLLPVDMETPRRERDVEDQAVSLQVVQEKIAQARAKFTLVVVDACRNNPLPKRADRAIGGTRGLTQPSAPNGQMVIYSAGANETALDKLHDNDRNPNGLFTREFIGVLDKPGLSVGDALKRVRSSVIAKAKSVNHDQHPAVYDQTDGDFYLVTGPAAPEAATQSRDERGLKPIKTAPVMVVPAQDPVEAAYWAEVSRSDDADSYAAYLGAYPNGLHVADANEYLERYKQAKVAREKLKEDQAWQKAQSGESHASYSAYLLSYPNGRYVKLAELSLKKLGRAARDCSDCPEMVQIPAGSFEMGSNDGDADEKPVHRVSVNAFAMSKTEITNRQFRQFRPGHNSGDYEGNSLNGDDQPVDRVSWDDAQAYVRWLAGKTGQTYRLPTEAEWEYAARAGTNSKWIWGNDENGGCQYANISDQTLKSRKSTWTTANCKDGYFVTAPVARFRANAFGLNDMTGNVQEWVEDCYHNSYTGAPTDGSAWTGDSCKERVDRGGSWADGPSYARVSKRGLLLGRIFDLGCGLGCGFRVVSEVSPRRAQ